MSKVPLPGGRWRVMQIQFIPNHEAGVTHVEDVQLESIPIGSETTTPAMPGLCEQCRMLNLGGAYAAARVYLENDFVGLDTRVELLPTSKHPEHPAFVSLQALKQSGSICKLCSLLWKNCIRRLEDNLDEAGKSDLAKDLDNICFRRMRMGKLSDPSYVYCCIAGDCSKELDWGPGWRDTRAELFAVKSPEYIHIEKRRESNKPGSLVHAPWRDLQSSDALGYACLVPRVATTIALAKTIQSWLDLCIHKHPECASYDTGGQLPDRVLAIGSVGRPGLRLLESSNLRGSYVALSYCWGIDPGCKTTKDNIADYELGIDEQSLPKTYRDAIDLCRACGYTFLWIDAFCIKQGDAEEWNHQSGKMNTIYGNAVFTIFASRASDVADGFLAEREPDTVCCGVSSRENQLQEVCICPESLQDTLQSQPLTRRAWAVQERALAPRKVHMTSKQMIWECETCIEYENGRCTGTIDRRPSELSLPNAWANLVHIASAGTLKHRTDRLPSISGAARKYMTLLHDEYLAGLWRKTLLKDMLWHAVPRERKCRPTGLPYRAPSWSWASVDGRVQSDIWTNSLLHYSQPLAELVKAEVDSLASDGLGEVVDGYLLIAAPCVTVSLTLDQDSRHPIAMTHKTWACEVDTKHNLGEFWLDDSLQPAQYYALITHKYRDGYQRDNYFGLLLLRSQDRRPESFQRAGVFQEVDPRGSLDLEHYRTTIRIV